MRSLENELHEELREFQRQLDPWIKYLQEKTSKLESRCGELESQQLDLRSKLPDLESVSRSLGNLESQVHHLLSVPQHPVDPDLSNKIQHQGLEVQHLQTDLRSLTSQMHNLQADMQRQMHDLQNISRIQKTVDPELQGVLSRQAAEIQQLQAELRAQTTHMQQLQNDFKSQVLCNRRLQDDLMSQNLTIQRLQRDQRPQGSGDHDVAVSSNAGFEHEVKGWQTHAETSFQAIFADIQQLRRRQSEIWDIVQPTPEGSVDGDSETVSSQDELGSPLDSPGVQGQGHCVPPRDVSAGRIDAVNSGGHFALPKRSFFLPPAVGPVPTTNPVRTAPLEVSQSTVRITPPVDPVPAQVTPVVPKGGELSDSSSTQPVAGSQLSELDKKRWRLEQNVLSSSIGRRPPPFRVPSRHLGGPPKMTTSRQFMTPRPKDRSVIIPTSLDPNGLRLPGKWHS